MFAAGRPTGDWQVSIWKYCHMLLIQTAFIKRSLTGNNIEKVTLKSVCH